MNDEYQQLKQGKRCNGNDEKIDVDAPVTMIQNRLSEQTTKRANEQTSRWPGLYVKIFDRFNGFMTQYVGHYDYGKYV